MSISRHGTPPGPRGIVVDVLALFIVAFVRRRILCLDHFLRASEDLRLACPLARGLFTSARTGSQPLYVEAIHEVRY